MIYCSKQVIQLEYLPISLILNKCIFVCPPKLVYNVLNLPPPPTGARTTLRTTGINLDFGNNSWTNQKSQYKRSRASSANYLQMHFTDLCSYLFLSCRAWHCTPIFTKIEPVSFCSRKNKLWHKLL